MATFKTAYEMIACYSTYTNKNSLIITKTNTLYRHIYFIDTFIGFKVVSKCTYTKVTNMWLQF